MIFTITMTDIVGLILRQNHYHQISQGHPTNDMSEFRALLFVIKWWQRWKINWSRWCWRWQILAKMIFKDQEGERRQSQRTSISIRHFSFLKFYSNKNLTATEWMRLIRKKISRFGKSSDAEDTSRPAKMVRNIDLFSFILFYNRYNCSSCKFWN